jgi:hypothetical protein
MLPFFRVRLGSACRAGGREIFRLTPLRGTTFQGMRDGRLVALPSGDAHLLRVFDSIYPCCVTQLVYDASMNLVAAHVFVDTTRVAADLDRIGTFSTELALLSALADFDAVITWAPDVLMDSPPAAVARLADDTSFGALSDAGKRVVAWMLRVEAAPAIGLTASVALADTGWWFDVHKRCFVRNANVIRRCVPRGWIVRTTASQERIEWGARALSMRAPPAATRCVAVDHAEWLVDCATSAVVCEPACVAAWTVALRRRGVDVLDVHSGEALDRETLVSLATRGAVVFSVSALHSARACHATTMHAGQPTSEHVRRMVRAHYTTHGSMEGAPPIVQAIRWRRMLIDDDVGTIGGGDGWHARIRWAFSDAPEILSDGAIAQFTGMHDTTPAGVRCLPEGARERPRVRLLGFNERVRQLAGSEVSPARWLLHNATRLDCLEHTPARDARVRTAHLFARTDFAHEQLAAYQSGTAECAVCLTSRSDCLLTCGHVFCHACVLQLPCEQASEGRFFNRRCPTCRSSVRRGFVRVRPRDARIACVAGEIRRDVAQGKSVVAYSAFDGVLSRLLSAMQRRGVRCSLLRDGAYTKAAEMHSAMQVPDVTVRLVPLVLNALPPKMEADRTYILHAPCSGADALDAAIVRRLFETSDMLSIVCCRDSPEMTLLGELLTRVDKTTWTLRDVWPEVPPPSEATD